MFKLTELLWSGFTWKDWKHPPRFGAMFSRCPSLQDNYYPTQLPFYHLYPAIISTTTFLGHHFSRNTYLALFPDSDPSDSAFSNGAGACSAITRSTARLSSKQNDWDRGLSWACVVTGNALPRDTGLDFRTMLRLARTRDCRYVSQRCLASVGDSGVSVSPFSAGTVPELFADSGFFSTMSPASMLIKPSSLSGLPGKSRAVRKNSSYEFFDQVLGTNQNFL